MSMVVNFSAELGVWIQHNLDRGCKADALVDSMVAQRFDRHVAIGLVQAFQRARSEGRPPPKDNVLLEAATTQPSASTAQEPAYVYETPRLLPGPVLHTADRPIPVLMRLAQPMVAILDGVLDAEECRQLIKLARPRLKPSTVVDPTTGQDTVAEYRDSEGMFFRLCETPFIARLDERISQAMNCPIEHGESLQVLRYGPQAKTTPHFDFLMPTNDANKASLARSGQRVSTMVIYLNEVEQGGETIFPEVGLAVTPKPGNAVYFEYANGLGQVDPLSVHAGAPVQRGEKWVLTKWMRARRFVPVAMPA